MSSIVKYKKAVTRIALRDEKRREVPQGTEVGVSYKFNFEDVHYFYVFKGNAKTSELLGVYPCAYLENFSP